MIKNSLPRLLLVSEYTLGYSQEGKYNNPTLYNLFYQYPPEQILQFTTQEAINGAPASYPFDERVIGVSSGYMPRLHNRLGQYSNFMLHKIDLQLLDWLPVSQRAKIEHFAPELILICPLSPWGLILGNKIVKATRCPFLVYFMDNWVANGNLTWLSSNVHGITKQLLEQSAGWLMISEQLGADLENLYQVSPRQLHVAHNPVDLSNITTPNIQNSNQGTFQIAYAGSIHTMHFDAVVAIAKAVFALRCEGIDIELVLYTSPVFWESYKEQWQKNEVKYGTLIPYHQLNQYLQKADLLLVATSFLPQCAPVVRSSILTKLTDYMAAGKPILSCGPDYSACNLFIKKWQCGIICETDNVTEIKNILSRLVENRHENRVYGMTGFKVLQQHFEREKVSQHLHEFIHKVYSSSV